MYMYVYIYIPEREALNTLIELGPGPTATARASSRQWGAKSPEKAGTRVSPPVSCKKEGWAGVEGLGGIQGLV